LAKKYIIGDLATGNITEVDVLPVVEGDNLAYDIQGIDSSEISVSKRDLPNPDAWKSYLQVGRKIVLAVDDSKAWDAHGEAIIGGGFTLRLQARVNDTIRVKVAGPDEYMSRRVVSSVFTGTVTNPETKAIDLARDSYQGLIVELIKDCFTAKGAGTRPTPPQIPITYPSTTTGTKTYSVLDTDFITYSQALEELQKASPFGNEWRWQWQWTSSDKTSVRLVLTVGADTSITTSQLGSGTSETITLDSTAYKLSGFEQSDDLDGSSTRLIAQTTQGSGTSGSDYVATVNAENDILYDSTFNPGVELDSGQLTAQISARMTVLKNLQGNATIEIAEPLTAWIPKLGNVLNIVGGSDWRTSDYTIQVRLTKVSGSIAEDTCKVEITPIQPRYPKLPPRSPFTPGSPFTGGPISPRNPPNFTPPGGTGITIPDFNIGNPNYGETESIFLDATVTTINTSTYVHPRTLIQNGSYIYGLDNSFVCTYRKTTAGVVTTATVPDFKVYRVQATDVTVGSAWSLVGTLPAATITAEHFATTDLTWTGASSENLSVNVNFFSNNGTDFYIHCFYTIRLNTGSAIRIKSKSVVFKGVLSGSTIASWTKQTWGFNIDATQNMFPLNTSIVAYGRSNDSIAAFGGFVVPIDGTLDFGANAANPNVSLNTYQLTSVFKKFPSTSWFQQSVPPLVDIGTFDVSGGSSSQALFPNIVCVGGGINGIYVENYIGVAGNQRQSFYLTGTQTELSGYQQNYIIPSDSNPGLIGVAAGDTRQRIPKLHRPVKVGTWILSFWLDQYALVSPRLQLVRTKPGFNSAVQGLIPVNVPVTILLPGYSAAGELLVDSFSLTASETVGVNTTGGSQSAQTFGFKNSIIIVDTNSSAATGLVIYRAALRPAFI